MEWVAASGFTFFAFPLVAFVPEKTPASRFSVRNVSCRSLPVAAGDGRDNAWSLVQEEKRPEQRRLRAFLPE
jgi:hypothetical protein